MATSNTQNPVDQKKLILAVALGVVAIALLWWTFFSGSSKSTPAKTPVSQNTASTRNTSQAPTGTPVEVRNELVNQLRPVSLEWKSPAAPEAKRNIFAYYEPPPPVKSVNMPTPTPTPTPPVLLASLSPSNVYARTGDFKLDLSGDKFTADLHLTMDGRELPTRYLNAQQMSANISAAMIANPGGRQITLRSADGKVYSNTLVLNVTPPPTPNYNYVGIIATHRHLDTAILQDKGSKEMLNVQRGDVVGGKFKITSISPKELVLVDTNLNITHKLPFSSENEKGFNPLQRPMPKVDSEDDEP